MKKLCLLHVLLMLFCAAHAVNADECLMTRMQEMSLDYHFTVEQVVGSSIYAFFGFNGKLDLNTYMHFCMRLLEPLVS